MSKKFSPTTPHAKKRFGCLPYLIIMFIVAMGCYAVFAWFTNPAKLLSSRSEAIAKNPSTSEHFLYILLVGSDKNGAIMESSRTDTIIVAALDLSKKDVFFLSVPRDSYVPINGYGYDKINHAYAYGGIDLLRQTVCDYLRIPIDYYALIDFSGFEALVDALGGVELEVDKRMYYKTYDDLIDIEAGWQRLNGQEALQYVRYRSDVMGDITRVARQQLLLKAIYKEFSGKNIYLKLPKILPALDHALETDLSSVDMLRLVLLTRDIAPESVESITLTGDFMTKDGISYWQVDEDAMDDLIVLHFGGGN